MELKGIGIASLFIYITAIIILNVKLKRKMAESMIFGFIILIIISFINESSTAASNFKESISFAMKQEVIFAAMAFTYMSYVMSKTGIISRLVNILNSFIGRISGGSGYVSTIASALFGMVSGSGSGNAAAVGSITIPWMEKTGWSDKDATAIVAGNAGLGIVFPPSSSMFLLLGMPSIAAELSSDQLYLTLINSGIIILIMRIIIIRIFAKRSNIQPLPKEAIPHIKTALKTGWQSLLIFLGVIIPVLITIGPLSKILESYETMGEEGVESVSLIMWIPVLITIIALIEGRKYLPKTIKEWIKFNKNSISQFSETGVLLFFAFASSRILIKLGLEIEVAAVFEYIEQFSPLIVIISIAILITIMVGPFTGTAATTAIGSVAYIALRSIDIPPAVACTVLLIFFSNEGCIPPNSAPIYVSCGISGLKNPSSIFKTLVFYYALPTIIIGILAAGGIIPLIH